MKKQNFCFKRFLIGVLVIALVGVVSVSAQGNNEICGQALEKCAVQAVMAGMFGGMNSFAAYASGCFMGYNWCLKYYIPLR